MTNAIGLVDDAAVLTMHCSYGRAQALLVLATEELARARFLYGAAEDTWSRWVVPRSLGCRWPHGIPRACRPIGGRMTTTVFGSAIQSLNGMGTSKAGRLLCGSRQRPDYETDGYS